MPFVAAGERWIRVDAEDVPFVESHAWTLANGYAARWKDGRPYRLHRELMGLERGDPREVDHINRNGLDNRRSNLRLVSRKQQMQNLSKSKAGKTSRHRNVSWDARSKRWLVCVKVNYKRIYVGVYEDEDEAGRAASDTRAKLMPYSTDARKAALI